MEKHIRVLARGLRVVECLQQQSPSSLAEIYRVTELPKPTLLRILHTLQETGWVYRGLSDDRYRLSYHLGQLGDNLMAADALAEAAGPILDELQADVFWPSYVAVRKGLAMEVVERTRKKQVFAVNPEVIGVQAEILRSAIGHAYFAFCSDTEREEILERLIAAGGEPGRLAADSHWIDGVLTEVRERGYGQRRAHHWPPPANDLCSIAVPVFLDGRVKACINIVWPEGSVDPPDAERQLYPRLRAAADALSEVLEESFFSA